MQKYRYLDIGLVLMIVLISIGILFLLKIFNSFIISFTLSIIVS